MQIQTGIMAQKQAEKVGQTVRVLCDGIDEESGLYLCRTTGDAPEVDVYKRQGLRWSRYLW